MVKVKAGNDPRRRRVRQQKFSRGVVSGNGNRAYDP